MFDLKKICLGGEVFEYQLIGHLNGFFAPRGGNLNKPIFKSSNARGVAQGVAQGGMLKLQFDQYITLWMGVGKDDSWVLMPLGLFLLLNVWS